MHGREGRVSPTAIDILGADASRAFCLYAAGRQFVTEGAPYLTTATLSVWSIRIRGRFVTRHLRTLRAGTDCENAATSTKKGEGVYALKALRLDARDARRLAQIIYCVLRSALLLYAPL